MPSFLPRSAARVLLVNEAGQVLLFNGFDPARPEHWFWFTPGGGLEPDEPAAAAAARELAEETGLVLAAAEMGDPVWQDRTEFPFDGRWYRQEQQYFLVRVPSWQVDTKGFDEVEQRTIGAHRWWSVAELEQTVERVYPNDLPAVLSRVTIPLPDPLC